MRIPWMAVILVCPALVNGEPGDPPAAQVLSATASLAFVSREGCVQNEISVFVNQSKDPAATAQNSRTKTMVTYSRSRYDFCEGVDLGIDRGTSRFMNVAGDLNRLRLDGTIEGLDANQGAERVTFSIVWTGTGTIRHAGPAAAATTTGKAAIRADSQSRTATVTGRVEGEDVSEASTGSLLLTTRQAGTH